MSLHVLLANRDCLPGVFRYYDLRLLLSSSADRYSISTTCFNS